MTRPVLPVAMFFFLLNLLSGCEPAVDRSAHAASATRIATLAPHLAELVYAAGAGDMLVGVSAYSDYPPAVADIEVVSDAFTVDQERLKLLAPDLVLAWQSGTPAHIIDELRNGGYRVEVIRTRGLDDIAAAIRRIGGLTDRAAHAEEVADAFEDGLHALRERYVARDNVTVFYQVSLKPLYTVNGAHYIGELIELCGGVNIFSDLSELAPSVTVEAVVDRNPEVVLAGNADGDGAFAEWRRWPHLLANRFGNNFSVNSDEIARPSIRLVAAAAEICEHIETARQRRSMDGKQ